MDVRPNPQSRPNQGASPRLPNTDLSQPQHSACRKAVERFAASARSSPPTPRPARFDDRADRDEPGAVGLRPAAFACYDSGTGNGLFGFGLGSSRCQHHAKDRQGPAAITMTPTIPTSSSVSGAEDLVPSARRHRLGVGTRSGPRPDHDGHVPRSGAIARASRACSRASSAGRARARPGDVHWRSISRDNVTTWYGGLPTARVSDPEDPRTRIFQLARLREPRRQGQRHCLRVRGGGQPKRRAGRG